MIPATITTTPEKINAMETMTEANQREAAVAIAATKIPKAAAIKGNTTGTAKRHPIIINSVLKPLFPFL